MRDKSKITDVRFKSTTPWMTLPYHDTILEGMRGDKPMKGNGYGESPEKMEFVKKKINRLHIDTGIVSIYTKNNKNEQ
jgi:hypothetical protein